MPDVLPTPPDYTVLQQGQLIAKVWRKPGNLRRAGVRGATPIRELLFADIEVFDAPSEAKLVELIEKSRELDALLFKLKLDGFEVRTGDVRVAGAGIRRF